VGCSLKRKPKNETLMSSETPAPAIGLAITGASGVLYGLRLLNELVRRNTIVHLTISPTVKHIAKIEQGITVDPETGRIDGTEKQMSEWVIFHRYDHVGAAPASGSTPLRGVAIVPCSMGTIGRIANGTSDNLACRMADVALKERRPLILVPRETPYSLIHLRNMYFLTKAGATILPASPGFYHRPETIDDLVNFIVARILQHLGFDGRDLIRGGWGEHPVSAQTYMNTDDASV
jgi:flavin prenyltransferase